MAVLSQPALKKLFNPIMQLNILKAEDANRAVQAAEKLRQ